MIRLEISLVKAYNWSLYHIDHTDIESLLPFIVTLSQGKTTAMAPTRRQYCDQVSWL